MTQIVSLRSTPPGGYQVNTPGRQPWVFMDRDGVWNSIDGFVNSPADLDRALDPKALQAGARLTQAGLHSAVVTNQAGVDLGKMSPETNMAIQERLAQRAEEAGGGLDAIYFCPNGKKFQLPEGEIDGRKPEAGMLVAAARQFGDQVDLADSYMIGDMTTDIAAGKAAGVTTILVKTGFAGKDNKVQVQPDYIAEDLAGAVDWILEREGKA